MADFYAILELKMHVERLIRAQLINPDAIQLSIGLTPERARSQLEDNLPVQQAPIISLNPKWWPRLPIIPFRIEIHYQENPSPIET